MVISKLVQVRPEGVSEQAETRADGARSAALLATSQRRRLSLVTLWFGSQARHLIDIQVNSTVDLRNKKKTFNSLLFQFFSSFTGFYRVFLAFLAQIVLKNDRKCRRQNWIDHRQKWDWMWRHHSFTFSLNRASAAEGNVANNLPSSHCIYSQNVERKCNRKYIDIVRLQAENFQSTFRAISEQFQSNFRAVLEKFQSNFRSLSEQFQSNFRESSEQF